MSNFVRWCPLDSKCISALRANDHCQACERVERCKLPEGKRGLLCLLMQRLIDKQEKHNEWVATISQRISALKAEVEVQ